MILVSVIIPVYNVEAYLRKCVDSILVQTYKNLEIILIDDGSPDNCGKICDEYALQDERIKVIHKENGGLSDARNAGLDICTGEYIAFVDSDDWVDEDYIATFMKYAKPDTIVCCGYRRVLPSYVIVNTCKEVKSFEPLDAINELQQEEITCFSLGNNVLPITNAVWNKLFYKAVFETLRFPKGKVFEDTFVIYKLFLLSKEIITIPYAKYNYLLRDGSICSNPTKQKDFDYLEARTAQREYVKEYNVLYNNSKILILYALLSIYINFKKEYYCLSDIEVKNIKSKIIKYKDVLSFKNTKIYIKYILVMYFEWFIKSVFAVKKYVYNLR